MMASRNAGALITVLTTLVIGVSQSAGQVQIVLRSGGASGVCGETDANTLVTSSSDPTPQPALIGGGNVAPECDCGAAGHDPDLIPITTHSTGDTWGNLPPLLNSRPASQIPQSP